jgi:hypothetical protein
MDDALLDGFRDEMEKIAAGGGFVRGVFNAAKKGVRKMRGKPPEGFFEGVANNVKNTAKAFKTPGRSMKEGWEYGAGKGGGWVGNGKITGKLPVGPKSLTVAGGALALPEAVAEEDPTGQGRSRAHRMVRWAGSQAGGLVGTPHGLSGAIVGGVVGEGAGAMAGRALDRLRRPPVGPRQSLVMPQSGGNLPQ